MGEATEPIVDSPLVSIIIPYYKRGEVFEQCLDSILSQDYPHREIIVIDDHSEDGVRERVEARKAGIQLVALPYNVGACGARNVGIRVSHGSILVVLDDDVGFVSPFELTKLVRAFADHPESHVLAFQICDPQTGQLRLRDWCHPRNWKQFGQSEFETHHFGEGASAFRREVFEACGLYYEPFFYGAEGHDMEVRILDRGFRILYCPRVQVWHRVSEKARSLDRQYYHFTRNYIWMAYKDYPFLAGLRFLLVKLSMMLVFSLRLKCLGSFLRGVRDGVGGLSRVRPDRKPIRKSTLRHWAELEKWRPNWIFRLARHKTRPQV